jgi:uncharacterized protein (TIGR02145 family)
MVFIKALLTGLLGVSLCMPNISGIVTDTGTTPISDAVVQLEKGGQTAPTGADGSFTLVTSTADLHGKSTSLPNGFSARIIGNLMTVTIAERTVVEIANFDLNGKSLSTVRKALDAGSHFISFPYRGSGIYLYKVKSGNREFVLKSIAIGGVLSGSAVSSQGPSSNRLAKQVMSISDINDVIAATKTGYLNYRVAVTNSDTSGIAIKMVASAGTVTDEDGNVYQTVRIGNQEWTVENLRVTKYNDGSPIPLNASITPWNLDTTPKYCFYQNTTNLDSIKKYGALYNYYVVNTGKLAPAGWHVPTDTEWTVLENHLIAIGYNWDGTITNNKIAKSMAAKTDWNTINANTGTVGFDLTKNNRSGFSGLPGGLRAYDGRFLDKSIYSFWWSAGKIDAPIFGRSLRTNDDFLRRGDDDNHNYGYSVRLVKD